VARNKAHPLGKGYVQVYTGNCKGKTTAALGLAFRAMGCGLKTYIGQFMKGQQYGELEAAKLVKPHITLSNMAREVSSILRILRAGRCQDGIRRVG